MASEGDKDSETPSRSRSREPGRYSFKRTVTIRTTFTSVSEGNTPIRSASQPPSLENTPGPPRLGKDASETENADSPTPGGSSEVDDGSSGRKMALKEAKNALTKSWLEAWENFALMGSPSKTKDAEEEDSEVNGNEKREEATPEKKAEDSEANGNEKREEATQEKQAEDSEANGNEKREEATPEKQNPSAWSNSDPLSTAKSFFKSLGFMGGSSDSEETDSNNNATSIYPSLASHWRPLLDLRNSTPKKVKETKEEESTLDSTVSSEYSRSSSLKESLDGDDNEADISTRPRLGSSRSGYRRDDEFSDSVEEEEDPTDIGEEEEEGTPSSEAFKEYPNSFEEFVFGADDDNDATEEAENEGNEEDTLPLVETEADEPNRSDNEGFDTAEEQEDSKQSQSQNQGAVEVEDPKTESPEKVAPFEDQMQEASEEKTDSERRKLIDAILRPLHLSNQQAFDVVMGMQKALKDGLKKETHQTSSVKCLPTYIRTLPTGEEMGSYLTLDLGGTNFRVMLVDLFGTQKAEPDIVSEKFAIPLDIMRGESNDLFDFIARSLYNFCEKQDVLEMDMSLAFTFSFPLEQHSLTSGTLTEWTKGFDVSGVEGKDVCQLFEEAMQRMGGLSRIKLVALLNDTTGVLLSAAWHDVRCKVGLILGTGSNACYLEQIENLEIYNEDPGSILCPCATHMVVNTEWGAFGENGELDSLATKWDRAVDQASVHPGQHIYEKMTAGMYLGELIRRILLELARDKLIFTHANYTLLEQPESFQAKHMCMVESDPVGNFEKCREALREAMGTKGQVLDADCYTVRQVCEEVSRRACMLLGAGIAGLLKRMDYHDVVVAVDGTLFRKHHLFPVLIMKKIAQLMGSEYKFELRFCYDGSGLGAAVAAAITGPK